MTTLDSLTGTKLRWSQPKWSIDRFELRAGQEMLGELCWTKCLSDQAVARIGESKWILDRRGFFGDRVVALESDSQALAAQFTFDWFMDGDLVLADGQSYRWYRTRLFDPAWVMADKAGGGIFEIEVAILWLKRQGTVRLMPGVHNLLGLDLLLSMGMYLAIITMQDETSVAAAMTAACGS